MAQSGSAQRILITGAGGFVGQLLLDALRPLLASGDRLICAGLREQSADPSFELVQMDVTKIDEVDRVIATTRPTKILHLAAISNVAQARDDPWRSWDVNLRGTFNLAEAVLRHAGDARFIFVGTSEAYGEQFNLHVGPLPETTPLAPTNPYASSKAAADLLIGQLAHDGLQAIRLRPFNHTGPGQSEQFVIPAFAAQIARIERGDQLPLIRVGNLDACRDFTDVRDIVSAYVTLIVRNQAFEPGLVLNLASGTPRRIGDVLEDLLRHAKVPIKVEQDPRLMRPNDTPIACGDASKAAKLLNWRPTRQWSETIADTLDYWRRAVSN